MLVGLRELLAIDKDNVLELDILFIAGDLFDSALWFSNEDVSHILLFMRELMAWCEKFKIRLRVLEGTPSHDRGQSRNLLPISKTFFNLDFRYIETMCVEGFEDLGLTCLYVPDEFGGSALKSQELIKSELDSIGYEKVDIAIMHGMFKYQVPEVGSDRFKYDEYFFLDRVRYFINIGHVHIFSTFRRIIAQGSTDRISHGEEKPKGGCLQVLDPSRGNSFYFIQNKRACVFTTIHVKQKDVDKALAVIEKRVSSLPSFSHVRIKASRDNQILNIYDMINKKFPTIFFTKLTEEDEEEKNSLLSKKDLLDINYTPLQVTKDNITKMLLDEVKKRYSFQGTYMEKLESKLKLILKEMVK